MFKYIVYIENYSDFLKLHLITITNILDIKLFWLV